MGPRPQKGARLIWVDFEVESCWPLEGVFGSGHQPGIQHPSQSAVSARDSEGEALLSQGDSRGTT